MTNENDNQQPSHPTTESEQTYSAGSVNVPDPVWTPELPWVAFNADAEQYRAAS